MVAMVQSHGASFWVRDERLYFGRTWEQLVEEIRRQRDELIRHRRKVNRIPAPEDWMW